MSIRSFFSPTGSTGSHFSTNKDSPKNEYLPAPNTDCATRPLLPNDVCSPCSSRMDTKEHKTGVRLPIAGVPIEFPYQPYSVQKYMMNQLLTAVKKAQNCLLESPTGTGKTLALLCSTLAWQQQEAALLMELSARAKDQDYGKPDGDIKPLGVELKKQPEIKTKPNCSTTPKKGDLIVISESEESDMDDDVFQMPKRKKKSVSNRWSPELPANVKSIGSPKHPESFKPPETSKQPDSPVTPAETNKIPEASMCDTKDDLDYKALLGDLRPPKIFYGTRTHKQIAQVVHQLKSTSYGKNVKMTILAARNFTCVNNAVRNEPNPTEMCQALIESTTGMGCVYYNGSIKATSHDVLRGCKLPVVFDIEDMVTVGQRNRLCPYFTLRNLVVQSDIVFCPYNYLIDPRIRESMNINLAKSVVVMDEAHNIEDTCREAASMLLEQSDLEVAIYECKHLIKAHVLVAQHTVIEDYFQRLHDWLSRNGQDINYSAANEAVTAISGPELINKLHVEGLTEEKFNQFKDSLESINQNKQDNPDDNFYLSGMAKTVSSNLKIVLDYLYDPENTKKYQAYLGRAVGEKQEEEVYPNTWLSKHKKKKSESNVWKYSLHLVCLSPAIVFSELLDARTIVLASGTLSPLDTFQSELAVKFPHIVKGKHVLAKENIFVSVVNSGPQKVDFKGIYENVNQYEYQDELGRAILETSKVVPHGVLCFLQSYTLMEKLRERWTLTGLMDNLAEIKDIFWEPRNRLNMTSVMDEFNARIELSTENPVEEIGAIMFGVFRGKIAEGIDFSDNKARAVLAVGIPFSNRNSKMISLKIKYNNDNVSDLIGGNQWYRIQAYRALNQALGRCLRHKDDWGAIVLLDSRFSSRDTQINLPTWIQVQLRPFQGWDHYLQGITSFCNKRLNHE